MLVMMKAYNKINNNVRFFVIIISNLWKLIENKYLLFGEKKKKVHELIGKYSFKLLNYFFLLVN
jgi:hypothetical protein